MPCKVEKLGDKVTISCYRGSSRNHCHACEQASEVLCDFDVGQGTCDRKLCRKHRRKFQGDKQDFCIEHYELEKELRTKE